MTIELSTLTTIVLGITTLVLFIHTLRLNRLENLKGIKDLLDEAKIIKARKKSIKNTK